jgi:hypothetical protein
MRRYEVLYVVTNISGKHSASTDRRDKPVLTADTAYSCERLILSYYRALPEDGSTRSLQYICIPTFLPEDGGHISCETRDKRIMSGPPKRSGRCRERKILLLLQEIEPGTFFPAGSPITTLTVLFRLTEFHNNLFYGEKLLDLLPDQLCRRL